MPVLLIQDFLQTQGLKLSSDDLRIAYLTAKTVMDMGNASIDRSVSRRFIFTFLANRMQGWFVSRLKASLWKTCWRCMKKTVRFTLPAVRRKAVG